MTEVEILEANKFIAEFMTDEPEVLAKDLKKSGTIESLHYHDDWNWLMPVVEKVENLPLVDEFNIDYCSVGKGYFVSILAAYKDSFDAIYSSNKENKLEAVYEVVVKFIKWHNDIYKR